MSVTTSGTATADGLPMPRRLLAIVAISAGSMLLMIDASIATVALPTIAAALGVRPAAAVLVVTVYQLVLAMTIMPFAALGNRIGHRRLYLLGLAGYAAGGVLCLSARSLPALLAVRACQSLSVAAALGVAFGLVRAIYPASQIGRGLGLNTLAAASGSALAPAAGGLILGVAPWPWVFAAGAPLAALALLLGRALPTTERHDGAFDLPGAALCAATFGLLVGGCEVWTQAAGGPARLLGPVLVTAGIAVAWGFVRHQRRQRDPVLPVDLLGQPAFGFATAASYLSVLAVSTLLYTTPFRLQQGFGFTPAQVGAMVAPFALASVMVAPAAGMLSDRIDAKRLSTLGGALGVVSLLLAARLPAHPRFLDVAWRMWLCGAGSALFSAPNARVIIASAPLARAASAGGLVATTRMIAQASGASLVGALLGVGLGPTGVPALVAAGLTATTLLLTLVRPRAPRPADAGAAATVDEIAAAELAG